MLPNLLVACQTSLPYPAPYPAYATFIYIVGKISDNMSGGDAASGVISIIIRAVQGFKYYRLIYITERSGNDLTDYQVLVELNSSNFDFTHTQTNGEDIRFTDAAGNLLDYWIEKWDAVTEEAKVWVKVPTIPANDSVKIWMYYGNPSASSAENPYSTFDFFNKHGEEGVYTYKKLKKIANSASCHGQPWCDYISVAVHGMIHHPHAIYVPSQNKVFFTWQGADDNWNYEGDPFISYFDINTKTWATPVRIGYNPTWSRTSPPDAHGTPVLWIDQDGYIHVLYGGHGVDIRHAKSQSPYDISSWSEGTFCTGSCGTYPKVFWEGNTIYVFRRVGDDNSALTLRKSTDGGDTWSSDETIVSTADEKGSYWWGLKKNGKIHFFAYESTERRRVYYFYFDIATEKCYRVDGTELSVPFTVTELGHFYEVPSGYRVHFRAGADVDADDNPFATIEVTDTTSGRIVPTWLVAVKWSGSEWISKEIPNSKSYVYGGHRLLNVKSASDIDLYFVRCDTFGRGSLRIYHSSNGLDYEEKEIITDYYSEVQQIGPVVNAQSECDWDAPIIIVAGCGNTEYADYASAYGPDFSTEIKSINWFGDTAQLTANYTFQGRDCLRLKDESDTEWYIVAMNAQFPEKFIMEYEIASDVLGYHGCGGGESEESWQCVVGFEPNTEYMRYYYSREEAAVKFAHTNEVNRWYSITIVAKGFTGNVVDVYEGGTKYLSDQPLIERPRAIEVNSVGTSIIGNVFVRNIRIRKYASQEPSVSVGAEETA